MTPQDIIEKLALVPLTREGGLVLQTYVSPLTLGGRRAATAIYYLLTHQSYSHLHRLDADEIYHFYLGDPVQLVQLLPDGSHTLSVLGQDLQNGQKPQILVPAGTWQGSRLLAGGRFALLGTTMTPGYREEGYEHGDKESLLEAYPECKFWIDALTGEPAFC